MLAEPVQVSHLKVLWISMHRAVTNGCELTLDCDGGVVTVCSVNVLHTDHVLPTVVCRDGGDREAGHSIAEVDLNPSFRL